MMSANQPSQTQDEKYSIRGVASISNYLTRRTVETSAQFFMPYLQPGMRLLDCGCGPGTISMGLAQAIAPSQLVGIDIDDYHLTWAEQHAVELAVTNVRFFIERAEKRGLIDRETLASYVAAIRAWAQHPDAFAANAWCEIVGWRR